MKFTRGANKKSERTFETPCRTAYCIGRNRKVKCKDAKQRSIRSRLEKKRRPPGKKGSPLIKYENVNFRLKKVAMCKGKKASNLNDIVIEEK